MRRILITGGEGFVGSYLCDQLSKKKFEIYVLDIRKNYISKFDKFYIKNLSFKSSLRKNVKNHFKISTNNTAEVVKLLDEYKFETIVHLAAMPVATTAIVEPREAYDEITGGTVSLLEAIRLSKIKNKVRFIYTSSSMVYGNFKSKIVTENHECNPIDIYGSFKLCGEIAVKAYNNIFGIKYVIVRPTAVYGPGDNNYRVIQSILHSIILNGQYKVFDPEVTRLDFTFVEDLARYFACIVSDKKIENETFNLSRGKSRLLKDIINIINNLNIDSKCKIINNKENFRPKRGTLSTDKIDNLLNNNFKKTDLEEGIKKYYKYLIHD